MKFTFDGDNWKCISASSTWPVPGYLRLWMYTKGYDSLDQVISGSDAPTSEEQFLMSDSDFRKGFIAMASEELKNILD